MNINRHGIPVVLDTFNKRKKPPKPQAKPAIVAPNERGFTRKVRGVQVDIVLHEKSPNASYLKRVGWREIK